MDTDELLQRRARQPDRPMPPSRRDLDAVLRRLQLDVERLAGDDVTRKRRRSILRGVRAVLIAQAEEFSAGEIELVLRAELFARR